MKDPEDKDPKIFSFPPSPESQEGEDPLPRFPLPNFKRVNMDQQFTNEMGEPKPLELKTIDPKIEQEEPKSQESELMDFRPYKMSEKRAREILTVGSIVLFLIVAPLLVYLHVLFLRIVL